MGSSLKIHLLTKEPYSAFNDEEIDQTIENEILHQVIWLSLVPEQLQEYRAEIRKIRTEFRNEKDVVINVILIMVSSMKIKYKVTLFGYFKSVNQIKEQILKFDERHRVVEPKFYLMDILQVNSSLLFKI